MPDRPSVVKQVFPSVITSFIIFWELDQQTPCVVADRNDLIDSVYRVGCIEKHFISITMDGKEYMKQSSQLGNLDRYEELVCCSHWPFPFRSIGFDFLIIPPLAARKLPSWTLDRNIPI
jgi:hypothetical protein